jgi:cobalt-zinc-cadmium resistance protein CzcA
MIATAKPVPPTNVTAEYGQFNSIYADKKLSVVQGFNFPKVYNTNKELLSEQWKASVLNVGVKKAALRQQVAQLYFNLVYLQEKKKLLQKNDSLYAEFFDKATLRFKKGESNIMEKTTAENQRYQIALQLSQLEQDMDIMQLQFQLLLNTTTVFIPTEKTAHLNNLSDMDSAALAAHPYLQYLKQQQQISEAETKAEKAKLLPNINIGYSISSMKGLGADDKAYNGVPQFHSAQLGLNIPVFAGAQKARIAASKMQERIAENDYGLNLKNFQTAYQSAFIQYKKYDEAVKYFESKALKNVEVITATANKQFINGDINYLEWVLLINQAITIQSDYAEAVNNRNMAIIEINSFINQ